MSGHSKWENIKRKKGAEDKKRGELFSKFARQIKAAIEEGGSTDPNSNIRLRGIIEEAKVINMPKENIRRLLQRSKTREDQESFFLEGYGPAGIAVVLEAATDNHQRTTQEIKNIFRRYQGSLSGPGSVAFQFKRMVVVRTPLLADEKILQAGDWGAADFKQQGKELFFFLIPEKLAGFKLALKKEKIKIVKTGWVMKAKNLVSVANVSEAQSFIAELRAQKDILAVFTNLEVSENGQNSAGQE